MRITQWMKPIWEQYHKNLKKNSRGTGGFTLVELIVTLVVLGILCTLGVMSMIGWQRHADFKKNNEYARDIFSAAQIQLTQLAERGQLTELIDAITNSGKANPSDYQLQAQGLDAQWQDENRGIVYYLKADRGDYQIYKNSLKGKSAEEMKAMDGKSRRLRELFDLLDPYIADKSILDAPICIEFDPDPKVALVYSVFYNDKADKLTYNAGGASSGNSRVVSIFDRSESAREKDETGYYGVEVLSRGTSLEVVRPVLTEVRLNNEETLNFSWSTRNKGEELTNMIYQINFYEVASAKDAKDPAVAEQKDDDPAIMTLVFGQADKTLDQLIGADGCIECKVSRADQPETTWRFPMVHNLSDGTMELTLDGLDLMADETMSDYTGTASIRRFYKGQLPIYGVIAGSKPGYYQATAEKTSNSEQPMMGSKKIQDDGTVVYTVDNARHLNNIRYVSGNDQAAVAVRYQLTRDISWEYALNQGTVYEKCVARWPKADEIGGYYFRPLNALAGNEVLESNASDTPRVLRRFRMDLDHAGSSGAASIALGLIRTNQGTIQNLTMEDVWVDGVSADQNAVYKYAKAVGTFCGVNEGSLSGLTVQAAPSGTESTHKDWYNQVRGYQYVGGIAGRSGQNGAAVFENLVNRAQIKGQSDVGGIFGNLKKSAAAVEVKNCVNYGKITGEILDTTWGVNFFGGIVGRVENEDNVTGEITISDCKSSPQYTDAEAEKLLAKIENPSTMDQILIENFVGGIIGYNDNAVITNCNTVRESDSQQGYIIGRDYVGGIAGYNSGHAGGLVAGTEDNRNQTHVIGRDYVGGIVGYNALGMLTGDGSVADPYAIQAEAAGETTSVLLQGWTNEGVVTAKGNYVGGITGYNGTTGLIEDCRSNVEQEQNSSLLSQVTSDASYAGGVVGYNEGIIRNKEGSAGVSTISVISGSDFVGGVVGCNAEGGQIENYNLDGGYITGRHFVGGFIGLNMDESIFTEHTSENRIISKPNRVTGGYFVGGVIGGNLISVKKPETDHTAYFEANNLLGTLSAEDGAYAGGLIGYNFLLNADAKSKDIENALKELCGKLKPFTSENVTDTDPDQYVLEMLKDQADTTTTLTIQGTGTEDETQEQLGLIQAKIYAGGIIGYNHPSSSLIIKDVENATPVEATGYVVRKEGTIKEEHKYSYAGGIIGKVEPTVTLDNCKNSDAGNVRTMGDYTGGLAELSFGTIQNCEAGNLGDGTSSRVGGLVGVNAKVDGTADSSKGRIINCSVNGMVSGIDYVGGLTAENYGLIDCSSSIQYDTGAVEISATGSYVGGLTGYAYDGSEIKLNSGTALNINISGSGNYVGGIAGANAGTITVAGTSGIENKQDNTITGHEYVGGFIGIQMEPKEKLTLHGFVNRAYVQAESGYVGGIAAYAESSKVTFERCENRGIVEVQMEDQDDEEKDKDEEELTGQRAVETTYPTAAGGITAINHGSITYCGNYAEVHAGSGYMGGIAAINYSQIDHSEVAGSDNNDGDTLSLTGARYTGGIAAINLENAKIEDCVIRRALLQNQDDNTSGYLGGITAQNFGTLTRCQVGVNFDPRVVKSNETQEGKRYDDAEMEAVAEVSNCNLKGQTLLDGDEVAGQTVALVSYATDVTMGGIAGWNEGTIRGGMEKVNSNSDFGYYSNVAADLRFANSSLAYYGYMGGVAGMNGGSISRYVFNGYIFGEANDPTRVPGYGVNSDTESSGTTIYGYGGLVGLNGSDRFSSSAKVERCRLDLVKVHGTGDGSNRPNVGGVAGVNGEGAAVSEILFAGESELQESPVSGGNLTEFSYSEVDKSKKTTSYVGTVHVQATNYGHVGGVVGYNSGSVSQINWDSDYSKKRELQNQVNGYFADGKLVDVTNNGTSVDDTRVLVTTGEGHVGGIIGYNRRLGSVSNVVTGPQWLVCAESQQEDNGTGGIIGYNISEKEIAACDNHATVIKRYGNAVGGIMGRMENGTSSAWRIRDCRNYGDIRNAASRVGGMIGNLKYKGGTLEDCINYGPVGAESEGNGGIIGYTYGIASGEVINVLNCQNHGEIGAGKGTPTGGIVGYMETGATLNISNCVNTGAINATGNKTGGILGNYSGGSWVNIADCRNYGYSKVTNADYCGIARAVSGAESRMKLTRCFGVTGPDVKWPLSTTAERNASSYSFTDDNASEDSEFWVSQIVATGTASNRENLYKVVGGDQAYDKNTGNFFFTNTDTTPGSMAFKFNQPVILDTVKLDFPGSDDGKKRKTSYTITFYADDGSESTQVYSATENDVSGSITHNLDSSQAITSVVITGLSAVDSGGKSADTVLYQFSATGRCENSEDTVNRDMKRDLGTNVVKADDTTTIFTGSYSSADAGIPLMIQGTGANNYAVDARDRATKIVEDLSVYTYADIQKANGTGELSPYHLFAGVDPYLIPVSVNVDPSAPTNLTCSMDNGQYIVSWTENPDAQYYIVNCTYHIPGKDGQENVDVKVSYASFAKSLVLPTAIEQDGQAATSVTLTVTAYNGSNRVSSEETLDVEFANQLPMPEVQWRLYDLGTLGQYRVILNNRDIYVNFVRTKLLQNEAATDDEVDAELAKIWISTSGINGQAVTFTAEDGASRDKGGGYALYATNNKDSYILNSYAYYKEAGVAPEGGTPIRSTSVNRETNCPNRDNYLQEGGKPTGKNMFASVSIEKTGTSSDIGFSGTTVKELTYHASLNKVQNSYVSDFRTELVADDPDLKVPVAFSVAEKTRISSTASSANKVRLSNLPEDFLQQEADGTTWRYQNVHVRAYPTNMSNNMVYQGWNADDNIYTAEELKQLKATKTGEIYLQDAPEDAKDLIHDTGDDASVEPGYVIVWKSKDTYNVYFNALLRVFQEEYPSDNGYQAWKNQRDWLYKNLTYMKYQIFYHFIDMNEELKKIQPSPVFYVNALYDEENKIWKNGVYDESDKFVITWDQAAAGETPAYTSSSLDESQYENAVYNLVLTGTKGSNTILLDNRQFTTPSRTGTGYNTYTADPAKVKIWDYDQITITITRLGTEVNGITEIFPSAATQVLNMRKRLAQPLAVSVGLQKDDQGVVLKDGLDYVVSFTTSTDTAEMNAVEKCQIVVSSREDDGCLPQTFTIEGDELISDITDGKARKNISLNSFHRNEKIAVTVQTIAKTGHEIYRDSLLSSPIDMTVPNRLLQPQMGAQDEAAEEQNLTEDGHKDSLTVTEYMDQCLVLQMKKENYRELSYYQIAMELYDTEEEAKAGEVKTGEESEIEEIRKGLPTRENPGKMDRISEKDYYSYTLRGMSPDSAGKWVRVVMKSIGTSSISSVWTDETDEGNPLDEDGNPISVTPYRIFKLPDVQMDPVTWVDYDEQSGSITHEVPVFKSGETNQVRTVNAVQEKAAFTLSPYANAYEIQLIQMPRQADLYTTPKDSTDSWQISDVYRMKLVKKSEEEYELTCESTAVEDTFRTEGSDKQILKVTDAGADAGKKIPYGQLVPLVVNDVTMYYAQVQAYVSLEKDTETGDIRMVFSLPDCTIIQDTPDSYAGQVCTEQILVQALADQEAAYHDSKWSLIARVNDGLLKETASLDQVEAAEEPEGIATGAEAPVVTNPENVAFILDHLSGSTRYEAIVTGSDNKVLADMTVPFKTKTTTGSTADKDMQIWFYKKLLPYKGKAVDVTFVSVFDVKMGTDETQQAGVSKSTTNSYSIYLGNLETAAETPILTQLAESSMYEVNFDSSTTTATLRRMFRLGSGTTSKVRMIQARQRELVWDYELKDTTTTGYVLRLDGTGMESGAKETVDLQRGYFGVMPGLEDYLTEEGKLLYQVSYSVDGDVLLRLESAQLASTSDANGSIGSTSTASGSDSSASTASSSNGGVASTGGSSGNGTAASGSNSGAASGSDSGAGLADRSGLLTLDCRLKAEYRTADDMVTTDLEEAEKIHFTLTLPDLSYDYMPEALSQLYEDGFPDGLYQTETFTMNSIMSNRYYRKEETVLDLTELRGELENDMQ